MIQSKARLKQKLIEKFGTEGFMQVILTILEIDDTLNYIVTDTIIAPKI